MILSLLLLLLIIYGVDKHIIIFRRIYKKTHKRIADFENAIDEYGSI